MSHQWNSSNAQSWIALHSCAAWLSLNEYGLICANTPMIIMPYLMSAYGFCFCVLPSLISPLIITFKIILGLNLEKGSPSMSSLTVLFTFPLYLINPFFDPVPFFLSPSNFLSLSHPPWIHFISLLSQPALPSSLVASFYSPPCSSPSSSLFSLIFLSLSPHSSPLSKSWLSPCILHSYNHFG